MARAASSNQLSGSNCPNMINSCLSLNFPPTLSRQDLEVRFSFVRYVSPHLPGWRFGPGFVCRNQEQQRRLGKPSVVVRWQMDFSTSRVLLGVQWPWPTLQEQRHYSTSRRRGRDANWQKPSPSHRACCCCVIHFEKAVMIFTFQRLQNPYCPIATYDRNFVPIYCQRVFSKPKPSINKFFVQFKISKIHNFNEQNDLSIIVIIWIIIT